MKVNGTEKAEIRSQKKFLAVGETCMVILPAAPGFKGRTFVSSVWVLRTQKFKSPTRAHRYHLELN